MPVKNTACGKVGYTSETEARHFIKQFKRIKKKMRVYFHDYCKLYHITTQQIFND